GKAQQSSSIDQRTGRRPGSADGAVAQIDRAGTARGEGMAIQVDVSINVDGAASRGRRGDIVCQRQVGLNFMRAGKYVDQSIAAVGVERNLARTRQNILRCGVVELQFFDRDV